ncbi:MAG TPA: 30S ribosomal protein S20 [Candidatus Gastranaerophilales bacterium]|nr:30S ribosomal protein S20 [Candidatus Gastranaerophilales bacterium]
MPNIKSAKKRVEINERNKERNIAVKSAVKTSIKKVFESIKTEVGEDKVKEAVNKAYSVIDKAVTKGIMHKNTAARKKSRLTKHVNKGTVPA